MPALQLLQPPACLPVDGPLHALRDASIEQRDEALKSGLVLEHPTPDERSVQSIEEIPDSGERRRECLEGVDAAAVFQAPDARTSDPER